MKRYITPATVIATVALFVALGGSSFAAANYINGASIKPNSIPANRLTQSAIATLGGSRSPAVAGKQGTTSVVNDVQVHFFATYVYFKAGMPHTSQSGSMDCPTNFPQPTGGGFIVENSPERFVLTTSGPGDFRGGPGVSGSGPGGWVIHGFNTDSNPKDPPLKLQISVGCLRTV